MRSRTRGGKKEKNSLLLELFYKKVNVIFSNISSRVTHISHVVRVYNYISPCIAIEVIKYITGFLFF